MADVSVQDPPLEQIIARVFEEGRARAMTPPDAVARTRLVPRAPCRPCSATADRSASTVKIFRASLVERMTYRGDFLLGTLLRFLPMVTTILLWQAIYAGSGTGPGFWHGLPLPTR